MKGYEMTVAYWDQVFEKIRPYDPQEPIPQPEIEAALDWLSHDARSVLDYACGKGRVLLRLIQKGVAQGVGIDLSPEAIRLANETAAVHEKQNQAFFMNGGLRCLHELDPASFEGAVLFNIIDNLLPDDAMDLVKQIHRVLVYRGRVLLKIGAWVPEQQLLQDATYTEIGPNLFLEDSGLYFWNLTNEAVEELLTPYFFIEEVRRVHFLQYGIDNRLFYLRAM